MVKLPIVDQVFSFVRKPNLSAANPRDREARIRSTFDRAPVGIALVAIDGRWLQFNDRFLEIAGYTREQLGRLSFSDLTHPDDAKVEAVLVRRLMSGDVPHYRIDKRIMEKKGKYRDITVVASLVHADGSDYFIYVADEPPLATSRTAARDNDHLLASVIDQIAEVAVIRTDDKGVITGWNAGAERVFGYRREEAVGKSRRMLYRDPDNWEGKGTKQLEAASDSGRIDLEDWRVAKNGSHFWVHTSITPVRPDGNVRGYIEVVSEAGSTHRRAEQARGAAEAKIAELKRTIEEMRAELLRRERTEESFRGALEELRQVGEETMNELRIMTAALRKEIDRRKSVEEELRQLKEKPPAPAPEPHVEEVIAGPQPPARAFRKLKVSPAELLVTHASDARSGVLVIASGTREIEVFFEKGRVFSVSTNDPSRFLTQRLIALGVITDEQREKALEIQRETHLAIGRILTILGAVTEEQLLDVMRRKAEEEILGVLSWSDAKFAFVEAPIPRLQLVPLGIDVAALVVQRLSRPAVAEVAEEAVETPVNRLAEELRSLEEDLPRLATELDIDSIPLPPPEILVASASGKTKKFHRTSCPSARRFDEDTRVIFTSEAEAVNAGFEACRMCFRGGE